MGKTTRLLDREFLGKIKDFSSKEEQKFEKAHLKAYKRGLKYFRFGKTEDGYPDFHEVKQRYFDKVKTE